APTLCLSRSPPRLLPTPFRYASLFRSAAGAVEGEPAGGSFAGDPAGHGGGVCLGGGELPVAGHGVRVPGGLDRGDPAGAVLDDRGLPAGAGAAVAAGGARGAAVQDVGVPLPVVGDAGRAGGGAGGDGGAAGPASAAAGDAGRGRGGAGRLRAAAAAGAHSGEFAAAVHARRRR